MFKVYIVIPRYMYLYNRKSNQVKLGKSIHHIENVFLIVFAGSQTTAGGTVDNIPITLFNTISQCRKFAKEELLDVWMDYSEKTNLSLFRNWSKFPGVTTGGKTLKTFFNIISQGRKFGQIPYMMCGCVMV